MNYLIDTHTHFDDFIEKGIENKIYQNAIKNNVKKMIVMSLDEKTSYDTILLSKKYPGIIPAVGIYPSEVEKNKIENIEKIIKNNINIVKAIGEIGIDKYHDFYPKLSLQEKIFRKQLELSIKYNLPVSIHARNAIREVLNIIGEFSGKVKGVIHSFTEPKYLKDILDLGLLVGINGIISYKSGSALKESLKDIPLDKIVLETDAPYLAPRPYKSNENEPAYLIKIAHIIADTKNISIIDVISETSKNAERLFKI